MDVTTLSDDDAKSVLLAVIRYSLADIATTRPRIPNDHHDLVSQDVKQCLNSQVHLFNVSGCSSLFSTSHCGVNMGEYFCDIFIFYDDDGWWYHKYFHCQKCGTNAIPDMHF
ncbi:hypothetical protein CRYUN_Cryun01aG0181800 [Craigia yunnanensis]